jgi:hypothetical protein
VGNRRVFAGLAGLAGGLVWFIGGACDWCFAGDSGFLCSGKDPETWVIQSVNL